MNLFLDAHEDLAYNMAAFQRDYTRPAAVTRQLEAGSGIPEYNGDTLLGFPEYQQARVAIIFSTLFATPSRRASGSYPDTQVYGTIAEANQLYFSQLSLYHQLCDQHPDKFRLLRTQRELGAHLSAWQQSADPQPVGLVPLMEGAEGLRSPDELERWWEAGLRIIGPAWAGNRFCGGTREPGPLTAEGRKLLDAMSEYGFILDLSHMDAQAAFESLERFSGAIIASHSNAAALVRGARFNRLLSDDLLRAMLQRGVVVGVVPLNGFLSWNWAREGGRDAISLDLVADQIDYICQMAGDAAHAGIGTDFDGGFGVQAVPRELDTIADLPKINPLLAARGYSPADIAAIDSGNFVRVLESGLPE